MPAQPGDKLLFYERQNGTQLGGAVVVSVDGQALTLDRDATPFAERSPKPRSGSATVGGPQLHLMDCFMRFLVQGGNGGTLRDSRFIRVGSSIQLASNFSQKTKEAFAGTSRC